MWRAWGWGSPKRWAECRGSHRACTTCLLYTSPAAVTFLVNAQDSDGGWDYEDVKDDTTNLYDTSDTNSTAMVLMALDATGDHSCDTGALTWLAGQQDSDGGFPYQPGAGSDSDSTALVVQAVIATGGDPFAAPWTVDGVTPLAYLEDTQDTDGGLSLIHI